MNEHEFWVFNRIKQSPFPLRCWINSRELLCCGPDFPEGIDWTPVGSYSSMVSEKDFIEDLRFSKSHPEPMMEA